MYPGASTLQAEGMEPTTPQPPESEPPESDPPATGSGAARGATSLDDGPGRGAAGKCESQTLTEQVTRDSSKSGAQSGAN